MSIKKIGIAALAAGVVGAGCLAFSADAASTATPPAPGSITGTMVKDGTLYGADLNPAVVKWFTGTWDNTVTTNSVQDGALQEKDFSDAVKVKLNQVGTGAQGPKGDKGDTGATGAAGKNGSDAIVSVTAMTALTNRPDSGFHGDWAKDTLTRSATITKQSAVDAAKCGPTATECYFYTGSLMDNGTFETIPGAKSPQAGVDIAGIVTGSVVGIAKYQFYATSATPKPELVPATTTGAAIPTARWGAQFFPATGVAVSDLDIKAFDWTYFDEDTCKTWRNSDPAPANPGDQDGINGC